MWGQYTLADIYRTSVMMFGAMPCHALGGCQPISVEDRVQSEATSCEIRGGQSGPGIGFLLRERQFFPVSLTTPMLHTHAFICNVYNLSS
jgi:hypothetical protein